MSSLFVEVVEIKEIRNHPNADKLDIVKIKGWECISQKGLYQKGDKVIYAPIDSVLPIELSDAMDVTKYLSKGRIKTTELRGIYSQGLLIPLSHLPNPDGAYIGDDVGEVLNITKYDPSIPDHMMGIIRKENAHFVKYTNIENIKNFPDIFEKDEDVWITEKLHGINSRFAMIDGYLYVGSHNLSLQENKKNSYWIASNLYNLKEVLKPGQELFGEIIGPCIQKLHYDLKNIDVRFIDLIENSVFADVDRFLDFCKTNNLPTVPELYRGSWNNRLLNLAEGNSAIANHIKEGIVIKPVKERYDGKIRRVILKHTNPKYLVKNYGDLH